MKNIFAIFILSQATLLFGQTKSPVDDGRLIRIPVVFHVISNSEAENVEDSLILNELLDLNLDFNKANDMSLLDDDFLHIVGNPNIEFYLLDTIFQNGGTKGIRRASRNQFKNRDDLLLNPKNCLNIFIAKQGNASNILSDRVDLNYKSVGINGRALTHETGHWDGIIPYF